MKSFKIIDCIERAYPDEFEAAKGIPEYMLEALYPNHVFGPAFPEIFEMYSQLKTLNSSAKRGGKVSLEAVHYLSSSLYVRSRKNKYPGAYPEMRNYWTSKDRELSVKHFREARSRFDNSFYEVEGKVKCFLVPVAFMLSASLATLEVDYPDRPAGSASKNLDMWDEVKQSLGLEPKVRRSAPHE